MPCHTLASSTQFTHFPYVFRLALTLSFSLSLTLFLSLESFLMINNLATHAETPAWREAGGLHYSALSTFLVLAVLRLCSGIFVTLPVHGQANLSSTSTTVSTATRVLNIHKKVDRVSRPGFPFMCGPISIYVDTPIRVYWTVLICMYYLRFLHRLIWFSPWCHAGYLLWVIWNDLCIFYV